MVSGRAPSVPRADRSSPPPTGSRAVAAPIGTSCLPPASMPRLGQATPRIQPAPAPSVPPPDAPTCGAPSALWPLARPPGRRVRTRTRGARPGPRPRHPAGPLAADWVSPARPTEARRCSRAHPVGEPHRATPPRQAAPARPGAGLTPGRPLPASLPAMPRRWAASGRIARVRGRVPRPRRRPSGVRFPARPPLDLAVTKPRPPSASERTARVLLLPRRHRPLQLNRPASHARRRSASPSCSPAPASPRVARSSE